MTNRHAWRSAASTVLILTLTTVISTLGGPVNPYPTDGWYQTQYFLFGNFPGRDNYTPIAAPALLYRGAHAIAAQAGLGLAGEFYIASVLQNVLLLLSACMLYSTLRLMQFRQLAAPIAIGFLLFILSTGLPQAFWSENATIFLMAAVLLMLAMVLYGNGAGGSQTRFWTLAIACGLLIGLLVVTRMTPIFLIPGIALLFFRRMPVRRVAQFTGALTLITLLMMGSMVLANHARFGRYELTNSSGRHLWQGLKEISDRALANSSDYQALRELEPNIQGKNWWEVPPVPQYVPDPGSGAVRADTREPLLGKLSKQAIANAPALYLIRGAYKFARSIGDAPYRLGFDTFGVWNPLNRTDFLPPPSSSMHLPPVYGQTVGVAFHGIYAVFRWFYPISIFAIALSCLAKIVEYLDRLRRRRGDPHASGGWVLPAAVFVSAGVLLAAIPIAGGGMTLHAIIGSAFCTMLLGVCASILLGRLRQESCVSQSQAGISLLFFLALLFFGSLWFSWQIEAADTRNTLPLLPMWSIMLAIAGTYWKDLWRSRSRNSRTVPSRVA